MTSSGGEGERRSSVVGRRGMDELMTAEDRSPRLFTSVDDAWPWFAAGGQLIPMHAWRARLTAGRAQLLSFQVPLDDTVVADEVEMAQSALAGIDGLAMFEREMLHISLRAVGFQVIAKRRADDVSREDVSRITKQAAGVMRGAQPFAIEAGPVNVLPGSVILEVRDGGELAALRGRLAAASEDAFGIDDTQYIPHVTIAMFADPAAAAPALRQRLPALRQRPPVATAIRHIELTRWWFTGDDTDLPERDPIRTYTLH